VSVSTEVLLEMSSTHTEEIHGTYLVHVSWRVGNTIVIWQLLNQVNKKDIPSRTAVKHRRWRNKPLLGSSSHILLIVVLSMVFTRLTSSTMVFTRLTSSTMLFTRLTSYTMALTRLTSSTMALSRLTSSTWYWQD
jgi:hypothetical protein